MRNSIVRVHRPRIVIDGRQRNHFDPPLLHAACCQEALGRFADTIARAGQHDDFETVVVVEVNMKRGTDGIAEVVLHRREPLGEIANVMIVDERERGDAQSAFAELGLGHLGADQVAQNFGARDTARLDERIEIVEQRRLHGDAKANEGLLHRRALYHACRFAGALAVLALTSLSLLGATGCRSSNVTTPEQCTALFEHYLDLRTAGIAADAGASAIAAARAKAREDGRSDPDVVEVTTECQKQVTQTEVSCAMAATTVRAWNDCID
jgi:hypothetical protein